MLFFHQCLDIFLSCMNKGTESILSKSFTKTQQNPSGVAPLRSNCNWMLMLSFVML